MSVVVMIPADAMGNKLYLKDFKEENTRMFLEYKSSFNDIPFRESEIFYADGGKSCVITGEDGTVIWRFPIHILNKLRD